MRTGLFAAVLLLPFMASVANACDPCALFNASRLQGHSAGSFTLSVSEQYTDFDRVNDSVENSVRDGEFVREFSTTQFALSYDVTEVLGLQATLPLIARRFDQVEQFRTSTQSDAGIGDASLVGTYSFIDFRRVDWVVIAGVTAGVKFPTGETGVLREVSDQEEIHSDERFRLKHHQISSASGGRALTFGTGSVDYILGWNFLSRYQRYLLLSTVQYTIRTEGDFDYEFADDFLWSVGSGYYFFLDDNFSLAGLLAVSGEFKGTDHLRDELVAGSHVSNIYLGPQVLFTLHESIGAELSLDFRVTDEDSGATVVPEARIRASLSYRFS